MTHTTSVRKMDANEGGRANLAGWEINCTCGFQTTTSLGTEVATIRREHITVMTRISPSKTEFRISVRTTAGHIAYVAKDQLRTWDAAWWTDNPKQIKMWKTRRRAQAWIDCRGEEMIQTFMATIEEISK